MVRYLLDRLFVPFDRLGAEQTSVEGSGIGLALTKQLLNIMNGTIGVSSTVGEGTTFWFELPIADESSIDASGFDASGLETITNLTTDPMTLAASEGQTNATVVYIEDNLSNVALVEKVVSRIGNIDLQIAMQGQEGLELIEKEQPDLVLLDLHLPLLGIERLLDKGADDYLTKPLDVHELADYVHKYLGA